MISNGQMAHQGTKATQYSFLQMTRPSACGTPISKCAYSHKRQGLPLGPVGAEETGGLDSEYFLRLANSVAGNEGTADSDHVCP